MKLVNREIENRVDVKLNKTIKDDTSSGIMMFGEYNDYPQVIEKLILGSQTAKACSKIYASFLSGSGFENEEIGSIIVGKDNKGKNITLDKIRCLIASEVAKNNGIYIHCDYNLNFDISSTKIIPFKTLRFSTQDDLGYCNRICYNPNWEKSLYNKKKNQWFNVFNNDKGIIEEQIIKAGNISKYKGQIYSSFFDDEFLYPLSPFDPVYLDLDTEQQIQLYKNRQIRNGFTKKVVMNVAIPDDDMEKDNIYDSVQEWLGPDGDSALVFASEFDENGNIIDKNFKISTVDSNIDDKLFENWEKSLSNNIRKAIHGLPAQLIDYEESKLGGTSGEAIVQMTNYYNALTKNYREQIAEIIKEVYSNFNNGILKANTNWNIKPLSILDATNTEETK